MPFTFHNPAAVFSPSDRSPRNREKASRYVVLVYLSCHVYLAPNEMNLFLLQLSESLKKHIFHLAWSPENLPTEDAIYPLLEFLDKRLQDVNR